MAYFYIHMNNMMNYYKRSNLDEYNLTKLFNSI